MLKKLKSQKSFHQKFQDEVDRLQNSRHLGTNIISSFQFIPFSWADISFYFYFWPFFLRYVSEKERPKIKKKKNFCSSLQNVVYTTLCKLEQKFFFFFKVPNEYSVVFHIFLETLPRVSKYLS